MYLLGKMFIQLIPEYLSYYQADFHPAKHDYTKLVNYWKARMADEYGMVSFQEENFQNYIVNPFFININVVLNKALLKAIE
jgi:hypothetical protein